MSTPEEQLPIREGLTDALASVQSAIDAYRAMCSLAFDGPLEEASWSDTVGAEAALDAVEKAAEVLSERFGHPSATEAALLLPVTQQLPGLRAQLRSWRERVERRLDQLDEGE